MKSKIYICLLVIAWFVTSCNHSGNPFIGKHLQIDKFPEQFYPEAEKLVLDAPGILDFTIADTIAITLMEHPDYLLQAYSLKSLEPLGTLLKKGKGPDEFLHVSPPIQIVKDSAGIKIWLQDTQLHSFFLLNVTETIKQQRTVIDKKYDLTHLGHTDDWIHKNGTLWGMQWTMENLELISYNVDRDTISNYGPLFEIAPHIARFVHVFSHGTAVKPDLSKIVVNMLYLNQLQIISLENTKDRFSFSTSNKPVTFEHINENAAELVAYYRDVRVTDQLIFASYYDVPTKLQMDQKSTRIHVFDWDGNPKALLNLPHNTPYFAIDEISGFIYCLSSDEELFRYNVKEIMK